MRPSESLNVFKWSLKRKTRRGIRGNKKKEGLHKRNIEKGRKQNERENICSTTGLKKLEKFGKC